MASGKTISIASAVPSDVMTILEFIRKLAEYEKLALEVKATPELLHEYLFGKRPVAEALLARIDGIAVGFALYFQTFSTFAGRPGIWLEDLFVLQEHRRQGIGVALLHRVASIAQSRSCGRLEWSVLDWNEPALNFYRKLGAVPMGDWTTHRMQLSEETVRKISQAHVR
jgi:GNAT superfamily N-acetyltransferase